MFYLNPHLKDLKRQILSGSENRGTFERRMEHLFPASDPRFISIMDTYELMKSEFHGKFRDSKHPKTLLQERYFEHLRRTTLIGVDIFGIREHEDIIILMTHDLVEDIKRWNISQAQAHFGQRVAQELDYLTKPPLGKFDGDKLARDKVYYSRLWQAPRSVTQKKLCDFLDNMWTIWDTDDRKKLKKLEQAALYMIPLVRIHRIPHPELFEAAYRELLYSITPHAPHDAT